MAVVVLTSGPGAPGVTTTALGLALTWPRDVLLADCDREPAQAVLAGFLRGTAEPGRGLGAITRLHRENRPLAPELLRHSVPLTTDGPRTRRLLPGFSVPGAVRLFDGAWPELADAFAALDEQGMDVLVDAGDVGCDGLPASLLARADAVCFVTRTGLRSLAAARLYLGVLSAQLADLPVDKPLGLVLVGPDRPYSSREVSSQFGVETWAEIGWDPRQAEVLSDGAPSPRRTGRRPLTDQFRAAGLSILERTRRTRHSRVTPETVDV